MSSLNKNSGFSENKQEVVSITYEEIGLFPRSFSRVLDRFLKQIFSDVENLVIQEYRFYRYLFLTTLKCLLIIFFVPFFVNFLTKTYVVRPLTEYFWNTKQSEIFLNSYQQKRAFSELKEFEEKTYFESLIFPKSALTPNLNMLLPFHNHDDSYQQNYEIIDPLTARQLGNIEDKQESLISNELEVLRHSRWLLEEGREGASIYGPASEGARATPVLLNAIAESVPNLFSETGPASVGEPAGSPTEAGPAGSPGIRVGVDKQSKQTLQSLTTPGVLVGVDKLFVLASGTKGKSEATPSKQTFRSSRNEAFRSDSKRSKNEALPFVPLRRETSRFLPFPGKVDVSETRREAGTKSLTTPFPFREEAPAPLGTKRPGFYSVLLSEGERIGERSKAIETPTWGLDRFASQKLRLSKGFAPKVLSLGPQPLGRGSKRRGPNPGSMDSNPLAAKLLEVKEPQEKKQTEHFPYTFLHQKKSEDTKETVSNKVEKKEPYLFTTFKHNEKYEKIDPTEHDSYGNNKNSHNQDFVLSKNQETEHPIKNWEATFSAKQTKDEYKPTELLINSYKLKSSLFLYQTQEASKNMQQRYQEKTIELAQRYNAQSIEAITNFFADLISLFTLFYLLYVLEIQINITKSFLLEVFFGLDDSKKSLLILLITDLLVGYHSSNLWELFFEFFFHHYGLPESQTGIFLLVATLPVLLDVLFKYLIFRHLNRSSPATVATYHAMIE